MGSRKWKPHAEHGELEWITIVASLTTSQLPAAGCGDSSMAVMK